MKTKLALALILVLATGLSGCAQTFGSSPTKSEATGPTALPTMTPVPMVSSLPAVWDLAKTMLGECTDGFGAIDPKNPPTKNPFVQVNYGQATVDVQSDVTAWYQEESIQRASNGNRTPPALSDFPGPTGLYHPATDYGFPSAVDEYAFKVISEIISRHPEFLQVDASGDRKWQGEPAGEVLTNDGKTSNPWSYLDLATPTSNLNFDPRHCPSGVLFFQSLPTNTAGNGNLIGEAYLFYEVGGTAPFQMDGQLKEVAFSFSPAS